MRTYHVYFTASDSGTLYVGVTGHLEGRVIQHKKGLIEGFSKKYNCRKLVYFEEFEDIGQAILREKQIKNWRRSKKIDLFKKINPSWKDLSKDWETKSSKEGFLDSARNDKKNEGSEVNT